MGIFIAFIIALLLSLIFYPGYRNSSSITPLIIFFIILFMASLAGHFWIVPFGPVMWGIAWLPLFFVALIFAFILAAASPPASAKKTESDVDAVATAAISIFTWLLLFALLVAIVAGYFK